ncbi:MAG: hypothetical protein JKY52_04590 [Flavobacteriales bacterium]|nr:hypothetical protein [Flavobacteriales bacterium]
MKLKITIASGILLLCMFFTPQVAAQQDAPSDAKLWIGISIEPKLAYRYSEFRLDPSDLNYDINKWFYGELNRLESPKIAMDYFLTVQYQWTSKFTLISGIGMLNKGEKQEYKEIVNADTTTYQLHNSYNYLGLPIIARYRVFGDRLSLNLVGGLMVNYFLQKIGRFVPYLDDYIDIGFGKVKRIKKIDFASVPSWNFDFIGGIDLTYLIGDRYQVSVSPRYKQELLEIAFVENGVYETHYSLGLHLTLSTNL